MLHMIEITGGFPSSQNLVSSAHIPRPWNPAKNRKNRRMTQSSAFYLWGFCIITVTGAATGLWFSLAKGHFTHTSKGEAVL